MVDFAYYNANVYGTEEEDCVTRAIKLGTGLSYHTVSRLLDMAQDYYGCDKLCVGCYGKLLSEVFKFPIRYCNGETVEEVARMFPYNIVIIRIDGHLTASVMGIVSDIWDCSKKSVDRYWIAT